MIPRNTTRAARTNELAQLDAPVTYLLPLGTVEGTITRKTEASVWATFAAAPERGQHARTIRFTRRSDGEFRPSGTGPHAPALRFTAEAAEWQARVDKVNAERAANGRFSS